MSTPEILLNSAKHAIVVAGADGAITLWNRAAEQLFGWSTADAVGRRLSEVLPDGDPLAHPSLLQKLRDGGSWSATRHACAEGGMASVVLLTASSLQCDNGTANGFMIVSTPLDGIELPQIATEREQFYREIVDTAQEGIWILNQNDETVFANERLASMLGYSVNEMLGAPSSQFVTGDGHAIDAQHGERYRA